ncbi:ubiquitin-like small modifier protein 1 [Geodermatophilus marinus]|uniref:ubiquitin-like small modifier protein 1 n=1 Tax=Geodermatophilus sp. LHW52908 TaxID=2303986 RepID=UPI000E3C7820|nr:ubiquitin-like small modifier protein 1 [Geodermatophilus sp. LHW52908]RFU20366.1 molybdopterin synthase sulfur carrier subunit [Geodermatophilus sp. LHW52908]
MEVLLPGSLADLAGGERHLRVDAGGGTLRDVLDGLDAAHPVLGRRIRDEAGAIRRFVNVYVDGDDVRFAGGLGTAVPEGATVQVLPSVAGG